MGQLNNHPLEKPSLLIAFGLLVLAFLSRFYGISEWHVIGDEYFTITKAYERYQAFLNPSYYAIVVGLHEIFGYSEWLPRVPALIMGVLSVPIFYLTWSRVLGKNAALFGALIIILSAWHLWFSQYGRYYSTIFFFATLAYYFFYQAILLNQVRLLILALFTCLLGFSFHVTFVFVPASCAVFYAVAFALKSNKNFEFSTKIIKIYLGLCLLGMVIAIPFLLNIMSHRISIAETWGYGPLLLVPQIVKYMQLPIVITAAFGLYFLLFREIRIGLFLAISIILPVILLALVSTSLDVSPSYVFYTLPLVILLSGYCCELVRQSLKGHKITSYVLITTVLICLTPEYVSHFTAKKSLHLSEAVSVVEDNYREGDKVLSFMPSTRMYTEKDFEYHPFIGQERDYSINWSKELQHLLTTEERTWVIVTNKRAPLAAELERWLNCNASLIWRKFAKRLDYEVDGYEVFLVSNKSNIASELSSCN